MNFICTGLCMGTYLGNDWWQDGIIAWVILQNPNSGGLADESSLDRIKEEYYINISDTVK